MSSVGLTLGLVGERIMVRYGALVVRKAIKGLNHMPPSRCLRVGRLVNTVIQRCASPGRRTIAPVMIITTPTSPKKK
jgi:hypothetical protein